MKYQFQLSQLVIALFAITTVVFAANIAIPENLIPGGLAGLDLSNHTETAKALIKERCKKQSGGDEAFTKLEDGIKTLIQCVTGLVDIGNIKKEIDEARPKGELDTVFHKYCLKRPDVIKCLEDFSETAKPCLTKQENDAAEFGLKIFKSVLSFVCYKGGDHIALFIAEGGPECLFGKAEGIKNCVNKTVSAHIPAEVPQSLDNIKFPELKFDEEQCKELEDLKKCVVDELEKCDEVTPANIIESLFRYVIKNETECEKKRR